MIIQNRENTVILLVFHDYVDKTVNCARSNFAQLWFLQSYYFNFESKFS